MLAKVCINNFKVFKMQVGLDLTKQGDAHLPDHILNHNVLKSAMIFGPNNVGKSCFVQALKILRDFALGKRLPQKCLLGNYAKMKNPTDIRIEVILGEDLYTYSISLILSKNIVDPDWNPEKYMDCKYVIKSEKLTKTSISSLESPACPEKIIDIDHVKDGLFDQINKLRVAAANNELKPKDNTLKKQICEKLLSSNLNQDSPFYNWLKNDLIILSLGQSYVHCKDDIDFYNLIEVVKCMDLGIEKIAISSEEDLKNHTEYETIPSEKLWIIHNNGLITKIEDISEGTRRIIELGSILIPGSEGKTFVIDEINRKLHPALTERLMQLFLGDGAEKQLIFTTHEIRLLDDWLFRRDEAWAVIGGENHSDIVRFSEGLNNNPLDEKLTLREIHDEIVRRYSNADE